MRADVLRVVSDERGQTTPFVLSLLMMLTMVVAIVVNVGQAVNRRIALQTLADAGAYSGANEMAIGMNYLARWNDYLHDAYEMVKIATGHYTFGFATCTTPAGYVTCNSINGFDNGVIGAWQGISGVLKGAFWATNVSYAIRAHTQAARHSRFNAFELFPGEAETLVWDERISDIGDPEAWAELAGLGSARNPYQLVGVENVSEDRYWYGHGCNQFDAFCFRSQHFDKWFRKEDDDVSDFVWVVTAPEVDFLMLPGLFGKVPLMRAAAKARPVGGTIEDGEEGYVVKMETLDKEIYDGKFTRTRRVLH